MREGQSWTSADVDAVSIGHDLARGTSAFRRTKQGETAAAGVGAPQQPEPSWETPAAEPAAQQHPEPAVMT
ncbi:Single-stranded DNA-binding protein 1 [Streptomyces alboniger]